MKLTKARVQNYRSIIDTGEFDIEELKTILVGPNEAGKTVLLKALQQLNKPSDVLGFEVLRDYPRSKFNDIDTGKVDPKNVTVVTGYFELEDSDKEEIPEQFRNCKYKFYKNIDNSTYHSLIDAPNRINFKDIKSDLSRLIAHLDKQYSIEYPEEETKKPSILIKPIIDTFEDSTILTDENCKNLKPFIEKNYALIEEGNEKEESRYEKLVEQIDFNSKYQLVLDTLSKLKPVFILFNNYFKVKPSVHLEHLATRTEQKLLDDQYYDYGNLCLLKLLGFTARELSNLGKTQSPDINKPDALKDYKDKLDTRSYKLNAASVRLTEEIKKVWMPNPERPEADKLKVTADGQYLKVVVEDDIGVDIELDQRSEGFQWLVSFFVVFFAEAMDKHKNAVLLLDEPGMSLHGLKQRDFRDTITRLAEHNQTIYTTHSPFLVGPDELDLVRVVELKNRKEGTKVHTTISSSDPAGLLPLQEALGYDLAQSLFSQQRNLILEGITDYWYVDATANLLRESKDENLNDKIALVFANSAGKVVYYATILFAHNLKVAALLDSDSAGDQAAQQENLVHTLGNKNILRTKDFVDNVPKAEIEDLLRETLIGIVKKEYGVDTKATSDSQPNRPIIDIFSAEVPDFSKYKLAKMYIKWTRENEANKLKPTELANWKKLIQQVNKALK
ncbi:AAA ATPase-like protein [Oceanihabitans sediminis]|uniref:OLD family endonuclease n=1 Tax=Oceanihabitans sediminis TaxID=1812012 RepID=A0A368P4X4_9FLAO|nr:AAA family ATPase [Oceanihabitans sediminis]RBP26499.1 AAA ATPase-like protein [Oceanihabitans sediminis]RCU56955.1 OLD family endonuclease [Oceanihabitans sediminis]